MKISHLDFLQVFEKNKEEGRVQNLFYKVRGIDVYCGYTEEMYPAIYLRSRIFDQFVPRLSIGKLGIDKRYGSSPQDLFLRIALHDKEMTEFFAVFANALLAEIEASEENAIKDVIIDYCEEWKVLFKDPQDKTKAIGLLGELYVLYQLYTSDIDSFAWNGNHSSPQDFSINKTTLLEIKTTTNHSDYAVEIHGINQLDVSNPYISCIYLLSG